MFWFDQILLLSVIEFGNNITTQMMRNNHGVSDINDIDVPGPEPPSSTDIEMEEGKKKTI